MFPVALTEKAATQILAIMKEEKYSNWYLRVGIRGGGCSGFQYVLDFVEEFSDFDFENEQHGIKILVDQVSATHLQGTVIDYTSNNLVQSGFEFQNPNAKRNCGCNKSFSP